MQKALNFSLKESGFDIVTAIDGEEALKKIRQDKPDLVLLDIILPKKDGFMVMEELMADKDLAQIPVIFLTNLGQKDDVKKGLELGAAGYIIKAHFKIADIIDKIKEVLDIR